jgi:hypothetical protein
MTATPKTIQIFLPGGDPRGIRVAEITTRIIQVIEVPRSLLPDFLKMPESDQVALYFLFGESEDGSEQKVYIGQTGDLRARLAKHKGVCASAHFQDEQSHYQPRPLPGMVLHTSNPHSGSLYRRKRQQRQPTPHPSTFGGRLSGDF